MAENLKNCPFCDGEARPVKQIEGRYAIARYSVSCDGCGLVAFYEATEAEAIAAWNTRAAHGTLTAEQVRESIERHFGKVAVLDDGKPVEWRDDWVCKVGIDYKGITDELNAELGSGTCKITATATNNLMYPDYMTKWHELSCGHSLTLKGDEAPKWCAVCGRKVER